MSATIRRRFSYTVSNDKIPTSSSSRRFSEDLCQRECDKGVFQVSGFTPYGKGSSQSGDKGSNQSLSSIYENGNKMTKLRRSTSDMKSILKKQNSNIDYSYLIPLMASEFDSVTSRDKIDKDSLSSSSSFGRVRAGKSAHNRRVRFNENISFHEQGLVTYCENLHDDFTTEPNDNNTIELLPIQTAEVSKSQIFESPSDHGKNNRNKFRKDIRGEPARKTTKLTQPCPNFGNIVSRPAWVKNIVPSVNAPDNVQLKPQRGHQFTNSHSPGLDRAKTDLGPVKYKDVQSKLRRMGCFDFRRNLSSSKCSVSYRHSPTKNRNEQNSEENFLEKSQIIHPIINENRIGGNYTTLREELYDITYDDDTLSVKYLTESCGEESLRSLGDQYARFLKGRYSLDDSTCS